MKSSEMASPLNVRALLVFLALFAPGCDKTPLPPPPPTPVTVAPVVKSSAQVYLDTFGNCATVASVTIVPQVTGLLAKTLFTEGAAVKAGDALFEIDPAPYQAAVQQAQGSLASAQATLLNTNQDFQRQQQLFTNKVVDIQAMQNAQVKAQTAQADVLVAEAALQAANISLGYCSIKSPISGRTGPYLTIFFNLDPKFPVGKATTRLNALSAQTLPTGVVGTLAGEAQQFQQTLSGMGILLLVAIFVMYVILGILYESYIHPITVLSTLPTAGVGGLLTLYLGGMDLSLYAFIGLFLLIGLVKKNGIMVVDFAIQRQREGLPLQDAVVTACEERLRPILMTTFCAIFGAIPLAIGFGADGASRQPLGLCIVGGLLISQILTLFVTPVFFLLLESFQQKFLDRIPFFKRGDLTPAASG